MMLSSLFGLLPINVHPLCSYLILFIGGIIYQKLHCPLIVAFLAIFWTILLTLTSSNYYRTRIILCSLFFLGGIVRLYVQEYYYKKIINVIDNQEIKNAIPIKITDITQIDHPRFSYVSLGRLENFSLNPQYPLAAIYTHAKPEWLVDDIICSKSSSIKTCNVSIADYFMKEGIAGIIMRPSKHLFIKRPFYSFRRMISSYKDELFENLQKKIWCKKTFLFFSSLFLGNRKIDKENYDILKQQFKWWGISHYLARSGLHLMIIIFSWEILLRYIPLPFIAKHLITLIGMLIYFLLTQSSISFVRAFLTVILYKLIIFSDRPMSTLHTLLIVTMAVLFYNPIQLFFLDFQLSFGITFLLAWFNHVTFAKKRLLKTID